MKYIGKSEKKLVKKAKSGIKIKPENKGKFTATKKKTGKSTEELTHSKNPVTKKRAIFAQNAAKWNNDASKKALGGTIEFLQPLIDAFKCGGKMKPKKKEEGGKLKDTIKTVSPKVDTQVTAKKPESKPLYVPKKAPSSEYAGHLSPEGRKYSKWLGDEATRKSLSSKKQGGNLEFIKSLVANYNEKNKN